MILISARCILQQFRISYRMFKEYSHQKPKLTPNTRLNRSQLPSIIRNKQSATASMRSNFQQQSSFDITSYNQKSNSAIKSDSKQLKLQIIDMNKKINSVIQKSSLWKIRSLDKRDLTKEEEDIIVDKETENTRKMMELYSKEYEQVMERKRLLRDGSKAGNLLSEIIETEEKIMNLKCWIKEVKKKMHGKEKQIVEGNEEKTRVRNANLFKELEQDYRATQAKISQMKLAMQGVEGKNQRLRVQNQASFEEFKKAEEVIREIDTKVLREGNQERVHQEYLAKLNQIESTKKRIGNVRSNAEQKYLSKLKELDTVVELSGYGVKTVQRKVEESREMIRELEMILENQQEEIESRIKEEAERRIQLLRIAEVEDTKDKLSIRLPKQSERGQPSEEEQGQEEGEGDNYLDPSEEPQQEEKHQQQREQEQQQEQEQEEQAQNPQMEQNQLAKDDEQPGSSMFLTMPQESKDSTLYKSPTKRKEQIPNNINSHRTISLRNTEQPEVKQKVTAVEVADTVTKANDAIKSIQHILNTYTQDDPEPVETQRAEIEHQEKSREKRKETREKRFKK